MTNQIQNPKLKMKIKRGDLCIERIGSLEEQIMIGGDLAVSEPVRMLIAILARIMNYESGIKNKTLNTKIIKNKDDIYKFVKKFYSRNEFEALYSQMEQDFNCQRTTSTGRILDAVSVSLGFAGNERNYKHEAVKKLEENSSGPYNIEPKISFSVIASEAKQSRTNIISQRLLRRSAPRNDSGIDNRRILQTTPLFEYLIKNIHKDKRRLAATAQLYIAKGLLEIIYSLLTTHYLLPTIFAGGGMTNNKIISKYLETHGAYLSKKIPRGDEGVAFGQIVYCLLNKI